jgi:membrane protein implicated in regulation of membrane protease activity
MEWWIWLLLGLLLLLGELLTPGGFYIFFFGIGALVVGILTGLNFAGPAWFQFILFSVVSVLALWLFREKLLQFTRVRTTDVVDSMIGESAVVLEEISANGVGKAEAGGTSWSARNLGDQALARGARCRVERVEGLTIFVRAEKL